MQMTKAEELVEINKVSTQLVSDKHELLEGSAPLIRRSNEIFTEVAGLVGLTDEGSHVREMELSYEESQELARLRSEGKQLANQIRLLEHQREQLDMKAGHDIEAIIHRYEYGE